MKKFLSVVLAIVMIFSVSVYAFAEDAGNQTDKKLTFNEDGSFKIMMMNDTQDVGKLGNNKLTDFINKALDAENPDLVIFVGDQLSDFYPFASEKDFKIALANILEPLEERNIPFLVTLGNHDHDREATLKEDGQYAIYSSYDMCYNEYGTDNFTFNKVIYSSDGAEALFNLYVMDSNNTSDGGYSGVTSEQVQWYKDTSNALKAANNNEVMPSLLFQHVPVKEIYSLFTECSWNTDGAIYSRRDSKWYVLNSDLVEEGGVLGEAPCSENFDVVTGQYQAWLEQGDILGAFFAHDHVNNFVGTDENGITMGYNGGTGFRSYGNGTDRSVRIFELNESNPTEYTTRTVTYADVTGNSSSFYFTDLFSPTLLTTLMKAVYACFGWMIKK